MNLEIQPEPNVSITNLQQVQQEGFSVLRSAHIGNARGYNLAIANAGIPMLLVDHNIVAQHPSDPGDRNYLPGSIVNEQGIMPLPVEVGGLVMRTEIERGGDIESQFIDELHIASLRQAFPETDIFTNTDYVRSEETVSREIVNIAAELAPELFTRIVQSDGTLQTTTASFVDYIKRYGILQLNDNPRQERGIILPNEIDMIIGFVIETLRSQRDTQYHLSGPDMQHYTKNKTLRKTLTNLYRAIRSQTSFGKDLPETLTVKLVPADKARYVTSVDSASAMQTVFELLEEKNTMQQEKRQFFRSTNAQSNLTPEQFLAVIGAREKELAHDLGTIALQLDSLFIGPREAPFVSQYDALDTGIVIAEENKAWTMSELGALTKQLEKIRGKSVCVT